MILKKFTETLLPNLPAWDCPCPPCRVQFFVIFNYLLPFWLHIFSVAARKIYGSKTLQNMVERTPKKYPWKPLVANLPAWDCPCPPCRGWAWSAAPDTWSSGSTGTPGPTTAVHTTGKRLLFRIRIHMFLGLLDPDPLGNGMDSDPAPALKIVRKTLIPTVLWLLWDFLCKCTFKKYLISRKTFFLN